MTDATPLLKPVSLGGLDLTNRIVMAPLTRNRAGEGRVPTASTASYYAQRASYGLLISEATVISPQGVGYIDTPGLYTDEQVAAWRTVTDAVHAEGGLIVAQLWHVGRVSHTDFHDGNPPVAPTTANAEAKTFTTDGFVDTSDPRALDTDEIPGIVADYAAATRRARDAGFDGVEVHAANGYLLEQFLAGDVNTRTDRYGAGSLDDRIRFVLEAVDAATGQWSADRVGIRLSLGNGTAGATDPDPTAVLAHLAGRLEQRGLAYVHVIEGVPGHVQIGAVREGGWTGQVILNGGYDLDRGVTAVDDGRADAIAYGRLAIANPDLPRRFELGADLNVPDESTFYGGGDEGYLDYPTLDGRTA
jgi:N-ethylmaleimide reductase